MLALICGSHALWAGQKLTAPSSGQTPAYAGPKRYSTVKARKGQDLVLDVLTVNRRAQALYQRLGMKDVVRHSDHHTKITMRSTHHCK